MPIVFVHGVANRSSPEQAASMRQRDELFKQLLLPGAAVLDPDWGSHAVSFSDPPIWLPEPGGAAALGTDAGAGREAGLGDIARRNPEIAIDLAFEAAIAARIQDVAEEARRAAAKGGAAPAGPPAVLLDQRETAQFAAAVRYIEAGADRDAFEPGKPDAAFFGALASELRAHVPSAGAGEQDSQAMGVAGDALRWLGNGVSQLVGGISNVGSDAALRLVRRPLSRQVALFLGDIFVYLRFRDQAGPEGTAARIFAPIGDALATAEKQRPVGEPLIVVGHSLGGVILYDMLSTAAVTEALAANAGRPLRIDALITVGSQPALFADMGLYGDAPAAGALRPRPLPVQRWLNVFDYTDVFSFGCEKIFADVEDFDFDNVTGVFSAHTAYFLRPSFYSRLRIRLRGQGVIA
jgi:hypothetical protein